MYLDQRRYNEAEMMGQKTLEIQRRVLGDKHRHTLGSTINLANVYMDQGRYADAEKLLRRVLEIDPTSALARNNLAEALKQQGHVKKVSESVDGIDEWLENTPDADRVPRLENERLRQEVERPLTSPGRAAASEEPENTNQQQR